MARGRGRLGVLMAPALLSQNETNDSRVLYTAFFFSVLALMLGFAVESTAAIKQQSISEQLDLSAIQKVEPIQQITSDDVQEVIPMGLRPTNNAEVLSSQIMDHSLNSFLNSPFIKKSSIGRTATAVEKTMSADMKFGGSAPTEEGEKPGVEHKVNFNMQPTQALAQMKYTGLLNANLNYKVNNQEVSLEMIRQMNEKTQLVMNSASSPVIGSYNKLSIRWDWF